MLAEVATPVARSTRLIADAIKDAEEDVADAETDAARDKARQRLEQFQTLERALRQ